MIESGKLMEVGKFQRTHALKGELNALIDIDPEFFGEGNPMIVEIDGIPVPFYVETYRSKGSFSYLVKLQSVDSSDEASEFVNRAIKVERAKYAVFMDMDEDDIVVEEDLVGFEVEDVNFGILGKLKEIDDSTENVLFIVESPAGEELMIPAADDFIISVDEEEELVRTAIPEGLLTFNSKECDAGDDVDAGEA